MSEITKLKYGEARPWSESLPGEKPLSKHYANYVLFVLLLVSIFNYIDRQILVILAEEIKADLGLSDADLGFLVGTVFTVFYSTFALALARLADVWDRRKLIALGLGAWSLMTALSGLARSFMPLAACRFGVAVGEASAMPASNSLVCDYFSPKIRATVLAIFNSGPYIGGGLGLFLGAEILQFWNDTWPNYQLAPFGLKGWQATFIIVGLPGLLMALWVATLREPIRGQSDGIITDEHPHPFREALKVLASMLPLCNLWVMAKEGGTRRDTVYNLIAALGITLIVLLLIQLTGSIAQWIVYGIGFYAAVSWAQGLAIRDPVFFSLTFKCKTLLGMFTASAAGAFTVAGTGFWAVPFMQRYHNISATEVGTVMGVAVVSMGFLGILLGGMLGDKLQTFSKKGRLYVIIGVSAANIPLGLILYTAENIAVMYVALFAVLLIGPMGIGPGLSILTSLVLPRCRASLLACNTMIMFLLGAALGPYAIGYLSDVITNAGVDSGEALRQAILWSYLLPVVGVIIFVWTLKHIESDEASLLDRARALGEKI